MKCFSEEEREELDMDKDTTNNTRGASTAYQQYDDFAFQETNPYKRPTKRVMSTLAAINAYASPCFGSKRKPYVCDYERINIKGEPGTYNKSKHLSRAQRKRLKQKSLKKKS